MKNTGRSKEKVSTFCFAWNFHYMRRIVFILSVDLDTYRETWSKQVKMNDIIWQHGKLGHVYVPCRLYAKHNTDDSDTLCKISGHIFRTEIQDDLFTHIIMKTYSSYDVIHTWLRHKSTQYYPALYEYKLRNINPQTLIFTNPRINTDLQS